MTEIVCHNIEDTEKLAKKFALSAKDTGAFVCLKGEVGSGKTAFVAISTGLTRQPMISEIE